jgi:hypothetical protein
VDEHPVVLEPTTAVVQPPLESVERRELTRGERASLARRVEQEEKRKRKERDRLEQEARDKAALGSGNANTGVGGGLSPAAQKALLYRAPLPDDLKGAVCPDPSSPDAHKALYAKFFRRMWAIAVDERTTVDNVIQGYAAARLAAGVGKEAPPPTAFKVKMASLLGGGSEDESRVKDE